MAPTATPIRSFLLTLALLASLPFPVAHAQVRVVAASESIRGRAPLVVFRPVENQTVPGQAPAVGHALRVEAEATDPDGDVLEGLTYRWLRDGVEIATGATYVPVVADAGRTLGVEATATTDAATTDPASGSATIDVPVAANSAPSVSNVGISGTYEVGQTLTGTYTFVDPDGDLEDPAGMEYLWQVSDASTGVPTVVGTGLTYVLRAEDQGANRSVWFTVMKAKSLTGAPNEKVRPTSPAGQWQLKRTGAITGRAPVATNVQISGTVQSGQTLSGSYGYSDADTDAEGASTFKWYRADDATGTTNKTVIAGAVATTYTVVSADQGKYLVYEVTPKSAAGTPNTGDPVSAVTASAVSGTAPAATNVQITGTVQTGQTLTGSYTYSDAENDAEGTSTYKWYRADNAAGTTNRTVIAGATSATYTVVSADQGKYLVFEVIPVATTGTPNTGVAVSVVTAGAVPGAAPVASNVRFDGRNTPGNTLTARYDYSDADGDAEGATVMQWCWKTYGCGTGYYGRTYTLSAGDANYEIYVKVTPKSATGTPNTGLTVESAAGWTRAEAAPTATPVTLAGTATVGQVLTGSYTYADANGDAEGTSTFKWYRADNAAGTTNRTVIAGAVATTYTVVSADQGKYLVFEATPVALAGTSMTGAAATAVSAQATGRPPTMTTPTITGTVASGQMLTGVPAGYADLDGDLAGTHTYKWYRADNAAGTTNKTVIAGAIGTTYTIVAADQGKYLVFEVTPKSSTGTPNTGDPVSRVTATAVPADVPTATAQSISGSLFPPHALTANFTYGNSEGIGAGSHRYQWYSDTNGFDRAPIVGAVSRTYTLTPADQGRWITVEMTPVSIHGATGTTVAAFATEEVEYSVAGNWQVVAAGGNFGGAPNPVVEFGLNVTNRVGNAPANLKVTVQSNSYGYSHSTTLLTLVAPDGSTYPLNSLPRNSTSTTTVNASSEVANGTWQIRAHSNISYNSGNAYTVGVIVRFNLGFTGE